MVYLIYAAGSCSRLKFHYEIEHKCLLEINGLSLIEHQLNWINLCEPKKIIIVVNSVHVKLINKLKLLQKKMPIKLIYNDDTISKNMKSFYLAKNEIQDDDVVFTTSDLYCDFKNIENFIHSDSKNKVLLDLDKSNYSGDEVLVQINRGSITRCSKKLEYFDGLAIGVYKFENNFINEMLNYCEHINDNGIFHQSLYYAIDATISKDFKIDPISTINNLWFDIDTYEEFIEAKKQLNAD